MDRLLFEKVVARANLAPSVHNTQPSRWCLSGETIEILCDTRVGLSRGDPEGRDAALSCGAALEATVLALSDHGIGAEVTTAPWPFQTGEELAPVARISLAGPVAPSPLAAMLERRFTHRGSFAAAGPIDWTPDSAVLVTDRTAKDRIAAMNDAVSLAVMRDHGLRRELRDWMRLSERHPRYGLDGMSRDSLRMAPFEARAAALALGPFWPVLDLIGATAGLTAEAPATRSAAAIAGFHRPLAESPVDSGRAYLRLWLEATALGLSGWPMAALTDDGPTRARLEADIGIASDRRLIQMIRLGPPTEPPPPRARRPLYEVIVKKEAGLNHP